MELILLQHLAKSILILEIVSTAVSKFDLIQNSMHLMLNVNSMKMKVSLY